MKEITKSLLRDDWCRISTEDGTRKYYIVGCDDQAADLGAEVNFSRFEFPIPTKHGPFTEWAVRSQLADNNRLSYLKRARKNLERAGVPTTAIDRFVAGETDDLSDWTFDPVLSVEERLRLCSNFFQAVRLNYLDAESVELDCDETAETNIAREKLCLEEVTNKYSKIVDRWEQLQRLSFDDPQLQEASKTFLYGFYRASVMLCASAVETQLKRLAKSAPERAGAFELIDTAEKAKLIEPDLARHARDLFSSRNRVAHDNRDPSQDRAKEVLGVARMLLSKLQAA
ncbi:MAG TPA: DUF4145 domain-containing protein [Bryobacteraceae bacterium]|nr:DUF4145 domain-containing protein [Bryobacteraceae bacterium]